jgi:low temperature requirement protein LtrA
VVTNQPAPSVEDDEPEEIRVTWAELFFDLAFILQ